MKKIIIMAAAVFATVNIFAQGTINFANGSTAALVTNTLTGARAVVGSTFVVQLYYAPDNSGGAEAMLMPVAGTAAFGPVPGLFSGGTRTLPVTPAGAFAYFQVRAWEAAYGTSYEEALQRGAQGGRLALTGKSNIIHVDLADPTTVPPGIASSMLTSLLLPVGLSGISLTVIPEPSVIGLGLLGVGALLVLRRRK